MAKKLNIALLFLIISFEANYILASALEPTPETQNYKTDLCDVAAPSNFRITSFSTSFITLAWQPAWDGAAHTLKVLEKNGSGTWVPFRVHSNILDSSFTEINLQSGFEYRFIIGTNCNTGEPSIKEVIRDGITLILELTIGGKTPLNPVAIDCHNIPYKGYDWIGFKVDGQNREGINTSSVFEFQPVTNSNPGSSNENITHGIIKRVDYYNQIVATNEAGRWPTLAQSSLVGNNPFRMALINVDGYSSTTIGRIELTGYQNSIDLCADYSNSLDPWDNKYNFTALVGGTSIGIPPSGGKASTPKDSTNFDIQWVQNPFRDELKIFITENSSDENEINLSLINLFGHVCINQRNLIANTQVIVNVKDLLPGIYILQVESLGKTKTRKTLKLD